MVKLKDIAEKSGMSVTQVSRALNNHKDVSEETKSKIKEIAGEMGYIKNVSAQKLAMQVSNQVVLIIKGFEAQSNAVEFNSIYPILYGINKYMNQVKYELLVYIMQEHVESYVEYFQQKGITGAILFGFDYDDPKLHELLQTTYHCVCIDIPIQGVNKGCVITNNTFYATQAVEVLINSGKKHIAMMSGSPHAIVSIEREAGYKVALAKKSIPIHNEYIFNGKFQKEQAQEMTIKAIRDYPEIDAFFCASDYMAIGCIEALEKLGKKIPEDVAIMGFDNVPLSQHIKPKLSTVDQNDEEKGYEAAKLLIASIQGTVKKRTVILNCKIKVRQST